MLLHALKVISKICFSAHATSRLILLAIYLTIQWLNRCAYPKNKLPMNILYWPNASNMKACNSNYIPQFLTWNGLSYWGSSSYEIVSLWFLFKPIPREIVFTLFNNIHFFVSHLNPSSPSAGYMRQWIESALVPIMACRLFATKASSKTVLGYC